MKHIYTTSYEVGGNSIELKLSVDYIRGAPATHEDPADPPEVDITAVLYKWLTLDFIELPHTEVLYQMICEDDNLALDIIDEIEGGPDDI